MAERLFEHLTIDGDEAKLDGAVIKNLENNEDFNELKSGLSKIFINSEPLSVTEWIQGTIAAGTGYNNDSAKRCRSAGYKIGSTLSPNGYVYVTVANGYKFGTREYTNEHSYVGYELFDGTGFATGTVRVPIVSDHEYRFVVAKTDDTDVSPETLPTGILSVEYKNATDKTLSISDKAADAKIVGDVVNELKVEEVTSVTGWQQGTISYSTGSVSDSSTRCRVRGYLTLQQFKSQIVTVTVASGFKIAIRMWDDGLNYIGSHASDWEVGDINLNVTEGYHYRFVIAKSDDTSITPSDISDSTVVFSASGYTSATFNHYGKALDSGAAGRVVKPHTATRNVTSSIVAAKTFTYADGTLPVVDWYLLMDYAGNMYISKDLRSRFFISFFPYRTDYKFAIRQNGDIIAVYRNEFDATGSYDSSLDDKRRNPMVALRSENYATWHEVDFGSAIKPTGWIENCGCCVLPNGDIMFAEYTRMSVLWTANLWRIKASADITLASSWEKLKTFRVAQNDTDAYDETYIEHFHTVQVDPYTGIIYFATGDKGNKSQIWYSKDGGDTWTQQTFVDPDTGDTVTSGPKLFRLLNFNFGKDYVYWSSDDPEEHVVVRAARSANGELDPSSVVILAHIDFISTRPATYGSVLFEDLGLMVMLERLDSLLGNSMLFRAFDLKTNTVKNICTIKSATGENAHVGFRTEYTEFEPNDDVIKCGFGVSFDYLNNNAICGNAGGTFAENINNLSIRISMDADRNVYAKFGTYYI